MEDDFKYCSNEKAQDFIIDGLSIIEIDREATESEKEDIGFIYLIDFGDGKTKIGLTKNDPRSRLKQLNSTSTIMPFELKLIALGLCKEVKCVEKLLHSDFRPLRYKGEWFDFSGKKAMGLKLILIESLYWYSFRFCFCEGWKNWKPDDNFIKKYSEFPYREDIVGIIDYEKNKEEYEKQIDEWLCSLQTPLSGIQNACEPF